MGNTEKMSYTEFIKAVAAETEVPESVVRRIYDTGVRTIGENAYQGRCVEIRNFGVFGTRKAQGRNVRLNNVSTFNPYTKFQFRPSSHFTRSNRRLIGEIKA